jgi:hypothetical protein
MVLEPMPPAADRQASDGCYALGVIGQIPTPSAPQSQFRVQPARAPIVRLERQLDVLGAKPDRQVRGLTPIGQLGTRIDLRA